MGGTVFYRLRGDVRGLGLVRGEQFPGNLPRNPRACYNIVGFEDISDAFLTHISAFSDARVPARFPPLRSTIHKIRRTAAVILWDHIEKSGVRPECWRAPVGSVGFLVVTKRIHNDLVTYEVTVFNSAMKTRFNDREEAQNHARLVAKAWLDEAVRVI